jgi:uncharacterized protein
MAEALIDVEVAYATPEQQMIVTLRLPEGATVERAIQAAELLSRFPEIEGNDLKAGIFGSVCKLDQPLRQADRVEVYRSLIQDPKEARRKRAAKE